MTAGGKPLIDIRGVRKQFRTRSGTLLDALADTSLAVEANQFICIVGPSGCGKSTLLRMIAGLETITSGVITIDGAAVTGARRDIGLVFQSPVMLPWRTIVKNVLVPAEVLKMSTANARQRAHELLKLVGLDGFADRYPDELSGGMRQRAAIARALMHDPNILLMDEPFGSLDAQTRLGLEDLVLRLRRRLGFSVILVTHDIDEAVYMADRVVVLSGKPATVIDTVAIDLGMERDQIATKSDPRFVDYRNRVLSRFIGKDHA